MSVLSFPRLYLRGTMSWDPIVSNNATAAYDLATGRARLQPGETTAEFRRRLIDSTAARGDWNYFGTHRCALERTTVVGAAATPADREVARDPLLGAPVELVGKLVDIDPAGVCSQIFFDELTVGTPGHPHLRARPRRQMSSRWLNFQRNLGSLPIAGNAAASWQAVFGAEATDIVRAGQSPLLAALRDALGRPGARGLMLRLCSYRTLYFDGRPQTNADLGPLLAELQQLHAQGDPVSNPAHSLVVGVVGVWFDGDSEATPGGRQLLLSGGGGPDRRGPAAAELHPDARVLSLDLANTIPELDRTAEKADLGPITVSVTADGVRSELGRIEPSAYDKVAYDAHAGIVDLDLPAAVDPAPLLARGRLALEVPTPGGPAVLLAEQQLSASCDDTNVYLDQDETRTLRIRAHASGQVPPAPLSILVAVYDRALAFTNQTMVLPTSADGIAELQVGGDAPGCRHLSYLAFSGTTPTPPPRLPLGTAQFTSVRTLPSDDALEAATGDAALTWEFVYANVLQTYDAIAPRMSVILDLGDPDAVQTFARRLKEVTSADLFLSARYMPVTRDLSRGKRRLLHRFCDLALAGALPLAPSPATPGAAATPAPDALPPAVPEQPAAEPAPAPLEKRALP